MGQSMPAHGSRSNWLLRGLVAVSLGIHAVIFMNIYGLYSSRAVTYIELTLRDLSTPPKRTIPRPRPRPKEAPKPVNVESLKVARSPLPSFKPIDMAPAGASPPDSLVEKISIPETPRVASPSIASWTPSEAEEGRATHSTPESYLEMVKLRIEEHKRYPEAARSSQVEGQAKVRFVITPDGGIGGAEIVKSSNSRHLDDAALGAVRSAAPFPKPPPRLFKGDISLVITIVFELT